MKPQLIARLSMLVLAAAVANGCGRRTAGDTGAAAAPAATPGERGYVAAPELISATATAGGRVLLSGVAEPGARVRMATPQGVAQFAEVGEDGHWSLLAPASPDPRFFGLSMIEQGRQIQAQGYLFVTPNGVAARLRAGGGTEVLGPSPATPSLESIDFDNQGGATAAGRAKPGETLTLRVDGLQRGQAVAADSGRYVVPLNQPLQAGSRDFDLAGDSGDTRLTLPVAAADKGPGAPFAAERTDFGWQVRWLTPGGGRQTTLIIRTPGVRS